MTEPKPLAEDMADLVNELVDEVATNEPITRYRKVRRGGDRTAMAVDLVQHVTRDAGLLDQLRAVKAEATTIPVKVYRWVSDHQAGDDVACGEVCFHGLWVHVRTEQRPAEHLHVTTAGAAIPGGSPGWDEAGALNPLRPMGFESASPATGAVELHDEIRRGVDHLRRHLRAAAGKPWGGRKATGAALTECVGLVLDVDDQDVVREAVRQVRAWVASARVLLRYDAPIVRLRDVVCGQCRGVLHVRADASTAVWCAGHPEVTVHGPGLFGSTWGPVTYAVVEGCGERYTRGSWIYLLEQAEKRKKDGSQNA